MTNYDQFAEYYDKVMWQPEKLAKWIRVLTKQYNPGAHTILELACGTGNLLSLFKDDYTITGLDLSQGMIDKAAAKIPDGNFIKADMTSFSLNEKFDVVACVFDSINHLDGLDKWGQVFNQASQHLDDNGIFIFDFNTKFKLEELSKKEPNTTVFDDKEMVMQVTKVSGAYPFNVKIIEHGKKIMEEDITEYAYSNEDIIDEAGKYFSEVEAYNEDFTSQPTDSSWRIYLVCRK